VHAVTGDTCYRGENGFSSIHAEVQTGDASLVESLSKIQHSETTALFRCAMLDVIGTVTKSKFVGKDTKFVICVEDMCYRKPMSPGVA